MTTAALRLDGVSLVLDGTDRELLHDISLVVDVDETVALLGASGCGKTLVGSLCAGFHPVGTTIRQGASRGAINASALPEGVVVPQAPGQWLPPAETVGDLLRAALRNWRLAEPGDSGTDNEHSLLHEFGFQQPEAVLRKIPEELSGGMSQRVAIAVAAALRPAICFLDEPTSGLDAIARKQLKSAIRSARHRFGALLIATHDVEFIAGLVGRAAVIRDGTVVCDATWKSVLSSSDPYVQRFVAVS